ncbi:MAG: RimK family alpha-L-glutamate ligase [bacterium]
MRGWILFAEEATKLKPETYEIDRFVKEAKASKIDIEVIHPNQIDLIVPGDDPKSVLLDEKAVTLPDFILPRLGAGTTYFALAVIRHLEGLGVYSLNSSRSIETVKDKLFTQQILAANDLPVPKTMLVKFPIEADVVEKQLGFPVVIKPISGTQGHGVYLSEKKIKFNDIMQLVNSTSGDPNIILQQFIQNSYGRDLRVLVVGGRVVGCIERKASKEGFKANFSSGGTMSPFTLTPEIEWLATKTASILGLEVAGVDLLFDGSHFKVCEANSAPAFEGAEKCLKNLNMPKEIFDFIRVRLGVFS